MTEKTIDELLERRDALKAELDAAVAENRDLTEIETESKAIAEEIERRVAEEQKKVELRKAVAKGEGEKIKEFKEEREKQMTFEEIRSSKEYIDAYVTGIKTDNFAECRALLEKRDSASPLLTVNASGAVPVPTYVEDRIKTAWENNEIARRIRRTYYKGNLQVGFEASSDGAKVHFEGGDEIADEALVLGIIELVPAMIKKTIRLSDEVLDMKGEAFLDYLIDEFENKIVAKIAEEAVTAVVTAQASSDATHIGVPQLVDAPDIDTVVQALALLTNDAANPVVVCNRGTYAVIRAAALNANYSVDPFEGCSVLFTSALDAYADASSGQDYMIVGDLSAVQANFPNGDNIKFVIDPYTEATKDLVRITGRVYAGIGITEVGMLAVVKKA